MASDLSFVEYVCDQSGGAGKVSFQKMFGEYAIYHGDKIVAYVCDNQLFVKPTAAGRAKIDRVVEAPPYPGAKMYFLIEDQLDDREWLTSLIAATASEIPVPIPKKRKAK